MSVDNIQKRSILIRQPYIFKSVDDKRSEAEVLGNLGNVHKSLGDYEGAIEHYQNALNITRDIGIKKSEGVNLGNLGDLLMLVQRWEEAERHLKSAVDIQDDHSWAAGAFMGSLAWLYAQQSKMTSQKVIARRGATGGGISGRTRKVPL